MFKKSLPFLIMLAAIVFPLKRISAQNNPVSDFCESFRKIQDDAINDFKNIRSSTKTTLYSEYGMVVGSAYKATVFIPGSDSCYIGKDDDGTGIYWSMIKKFTSQPDAEKKFLEIKKQLEGCLKNYFIRNPSKEEWKKNAIQQTEFGPYYNYVSKMPYMYLQLEKQDKNFTLNLRMISPVEGPGVFCRKLKEVMNHSSSNFEKLNSGEAQSPEFVDEDGYEEINFAFSRSTLDFPGAKQSSIYLSTDFVGFFGLYKTKNEAAKKIDSIRSKLSGCLINYKVVNEPSEFYAIHYVFKEPVKNKARELELYAEKIMIDNRLKVRLMIKGLKE
jgi:hypothetical protein